MRGQENLEQKKKKKKEKKKKKKKEKKKKKRATWRRELSLPRKPRQLTLCKPKEGNVSEERKRKWERR